MERIKIFKELKIDSKQLSLLYGGAGGVGTSIMGEECRDTWYDNDNDGKISPGDQICYHGCANE